MIEHPPDANTLQDVKRPLVACGGGLFTHPAFYTTFILIHFIALYCILLKSAFISIAYNSIVRNIIGIYNEYNGI